MEIPLSAQSELNLLKGYVIDKNTNERIYNANILIIETGQGTTSNEKGYFELKLPSGYYNIQISFVGYEKFKKEIYVNEDEETGYYFELNPVSINLDTVKILGEKNNNDVNKGIVLLPGELKDIPQFGEPESI